LPLVVVPVRPFAGVPGLPVEVVPVRLFAGAPGVRRWCWAGCVPKKFEMVKNRNFGQKSKFWSKIEILVKNRNFGQKIEIVVKNRNFGQRYKF